MKTKKLSPYVPVIKRFLSEEKTRLFCGADWGRETKACKDMLSENSLTPEEALLMPKPPFQVNSLNFFKTANGKKYVLEWRGKQTRNEQLSNQLSSAAVEEYPLNEQPVLVNVAIRPKTVMEFILWPKKPQNQ